MKTTLNIPDSLIKEAMQLAGLGTKTETVRLALEELIKQKRLETIIARAGTLKFSSDWDKARHDRHASAGVLYRKNKQMKVLTKKPYKHY